MLDSWTSGFESYRKVLQVIIVQNKDFGQYLCDLKAEVHDGN